MNGCMRTGCHRRIKPTKLSLDETASVQSVGRFTNGRPGAATSDYGPPGQLRVTCKPVLDNSSVTNRARLLGGLSSRRCLMRSAANSSFANISK